ncbi:lytic transglycosylase domain-containing protein, partial [Bacteroidota bacterium]
YNNGKSGLDKQIEIQKQNNYYNLLLNEETARYIFRILAIKTILSQPNKYGFYFRQSDLYKPIETYIVEVNSNVTDFADFAEKYGINYKVLKFFNPWLRKNYLTNSKKNKYYIKIPYKFERDFTSQVEIN